MQGQLAEGLSPSAQRRLLVSAASLIAVVAIVLALLIGFQTPRYEATSRLAYSPQGLPLRVEQSPTAGTVISGLPAGQGAATSTARRALDDQQLSTLIARYDVYPDLRKRESSQQLVSKVRQYLTFAEPQPGILKVSFQDKDHDRSLAFTNGVVSVLASYEADETISTPVPTPKASKVGRSLSRPPTPLARVAPVPDAGQQAEALQHQMDRVESALRDVASSRADLQEQQHEVVAKMATLEKNERRALSAEVRVGAQDGAHERTALDQQLAAERSKLASLRDRYTEEYPDVQRTEENIANLQARINHLAETTAANPAATSSALSPAMEKLTQEKQRIEHDLEQNAATASIEEERKASLEQQALVMRTRPPSATLPVPSPPAPSTASVPVAPPSVATTTVRILPFHILETATVATQVGSSRLTLALWLAGGTLILLVLCFVPMVPAHYAEVVKNADDLQQSLPKHVAYLGDVGRTEP